MHVGYGKRAKKNTSNKIFWLFLGFPGFWKPEFHWWCDAVKIVYQYYTTGNKYLEVVEEEKNV